MFYTAIWCTGDEQRLMESVPLHLLGESLRRYGSTMRLRTVVLEGYQCLSADTVRRLEAVGLEIVNGEKLFAATLEEYPEINRRYSRYERNCFLRWPVIRKIINQGNGSCQFWHLDSDIILHTSLDEIAEATSGQTFILQGTPAFVSAADPGWLETYEHELKKLNDDLTGYSALAFTKKGECKTQDARLCNQSLYRNPIGSDQDLLQYLVSSRVIPQDEVTSIFKGDYYYILNALNLSYWRAMQGGDAAFTQQGDREIWYGNRKVPFMHYQSSFCAYAGVYLKLRHSPWRRFMKPLLRYTLEEGVYSENIVLNVFRRSLKLARLTLSRRDLIVRLMHSDAEGHSPLVDLLNHLDLRHG